MSNRNVKYPHVTISLVSDDESEDYDLFITLFLVGNALLRAGVSSDEVVLFFQEALFDGRNTVLPTIMNWVEVE